MNLLWIVLPSAVVLAVAYLTYGRLLGRLLRLDPHAPVPAVEQEELPVTARLRQELAALTQYEWDTPALRDLAELARQAGARKLRAELSYRIVRSDTSLTRAAIDDIAKQVLGDGE